MSGLAETRQVIIVTGLSGAGKNSLLHTLEDLGFETVDNPPLDTLEVLAKKAERNLAVGVDVRSRGFSAATVLEALEALRRVQGLYPTLVYMTAEDAVLLRRYSETRRRHPQAKSGTVTDGIVLERQLTAPLVKAADWLLDTSCLPLPKLRQLASQRFGGDAPGLSVSLVSFSYALGLPPTADLVFDARFLKNPHYDPALRPLSGLDPEVGSFIEQDHDFEVYFDKVLNLINFLLPRFVQEGKKYATICVGCTGGQHRSVYMVEKLYAPLARAGWQISVMHREAAKFARSGVRQEGIAQNP